MVIVRKLAREMWFFGWLERCPAPLAFGNPPAPLPSNGQAAGKAPVDHPFEGNRAIGKQSEQPCVAMKGMIAQSEWSDSSTLQLQVGAVEFQIS